LLSALCLRQKNSSIPITVISDLPILGYLALEQYAISPRLLRADEIIVSPFFSRYIKTQVYRYSPYAYTLYLDADVLPVGDIAQIWHYLDDGDLAMTRDRLPEIQQCNHVGATETNFTLQNLPGYFPHYNSGVMLWRNTPDVEALFATWHQEWLRFQQQDQLALTRAIAATQQPVTIMPKSYNISPRDAEPLFKQGKPIHILHCWGKVSNGSFKKLCMRFCPEAVRHVDQLWDKATTVSHAPILHQEDLTKSHHLVSP